MSLRYRLLYRLGITPGIRITFPASWPHSSKDLRRSLPGLHSTSAAAPAPNRSTSPNTDGR